MSYWESVFLQSKVNRGAYDGDRLPTQNWDWPRETWFQKRLGYLRKTQPVLQCEDRTGLVIASQSQWEYRERRLQGQTTFKEIGHGVPTMLDRQRGQVPGLY
jgi:hypothetical protein